MSETLKYLFIAYFTDGTKIVQGPSDRSEIDPEKRSAFYDVMQAIEKGKKLKYFVIQNIDNTISVNLTNGIFNINGLKVLLESEKLPAMPDHFDLIYYRQWTRNIDVTYSKTSGNVVNTGNESSFCEYFIGWKCNINGKSYQQKIGVS